MAAIFITDARGTLSDGSDAFSNIEALRFSDQTMELLREPASACRPARGARKMTRKLTVLHQAFCSVDPASRHDQR